MHCITLDEEGLATRQNFGDMVTFDLDRFGKFPKGILSKSGRAISVVLHQDGPYKVISHCIRL